MRICGRKITTPPTPAISPSTRRPRSALSGKTSFKYPWIAPKPASIPSISGVAQAKTAWKTRNINASSTTTPRTGCRTIRSRRSVAVSGRTARRTDTERMRLASSA